MQVICKDGTTIQCQDFEALDSGVLLFQEGAGGRERAEGDEAEDEADEGERRAAGFVPITEIRYVLSRELRPRQTGGAQSGQPQPGQSTRGAPGPQTQPPQGQSVGRQSPGAGQSAPGAGQRPPGTGYGTQGPGGQ